MERHSVIIAWLAAIVTMTTGRSTYMVTVPQYIRPGEEFSVCMVPLVPHLGQTFIQFTLMDRKNKTLNFQEESAYFANDPVIFKIMVPEEARRTYGFQLEIKATGGIVFQKRVININLSSKTSSIFVQTDKAAYLPGDLVQFRVFGTNSKLKVLEEPMNITITDPKGNRVDQYLNVSPSFGVFTGAFQLSTLTNFGTWRIDIKQKKTDFQKRFTVEKHVLPKFVINIEFPEFQMQTDEFFYIDLIAKYTFGGPVEGLVNMTINRRWSSWNSINKLFRMRGKASVKILMTEIIRRFGSGVRVNVEFTERLTRKTSKDTQYTQIYYRREKLSSSSFMPYHFKPGVDYKYIVKLSSLDGAPLETPLDTMNVTVWYYVRIPIPKHFDTQVMSINPRRTKRRLLWSKLIDISDSGIVETTAQFPLAAVRGYFDVKYNKTLSTTHSVSKAYSASNNFLQVTVMNDAKAEIGKRLPILLETTERPNFVYYKVLSKGSLVTHGRWVMRSRRKIFTLMITTDMAPSAKLLVYYVRRRNSEIVADAIIFPIEDIFKSNKVTLEFNKERALPGEKVDLQINADPHSLVNLLSVDKSVLLYKTGNDITFQDVMTDLQTYDRNFNRFARSWDSRFPRHIVGEDAFDLFTQTGLYVVTDALLYQYLIECDSPSPSFAGKMVFRSGATGLSQRMAGPSANVGLVTPARVRKYFPATWIWTNTTTSSDGTALYTATTPDTITTWVTSAFAVNPSSGLALASEFANITTFLNFFMRFDLPYSAIRGEVVIVLISIFNFLPRTQEVYVTMTSSPDFDFVDNNGQPINVGPTGLTRRIAVDSDRIEGVYVPIIGTKVGTITFNAQARSTEAADAVEQIFIIEAEGITQAYNMPFVVNLKQTNSFF